MKGLPRTALLVYDRGYFEYTLQLELKIEFVKSCLVSWKGLLSSTLGFISHGNDCKKEFLHVMSRIHLMKKFMKFLILYFLMETQI